MVKEFRALSRAEAVESMYQDMAARHRARFRNVQILRVAEVEKKEDVRRPYIKQLLEPGLKFPLPHRRTTSKNWFAANRPVSLPLMLLRSMLTDRPLGPKRLYHLYERLILWSGFGSACICAHQDILNRHLTDTRTCHFHTDIPTTKWTSQPIY
jgi:ribosomal protein L20A (L18A)